MLKSLHRSHRIFLPVFLLLSFATFSQIRIASPYSRFGIGIISQNNSAWNFSMGEAGIAMRSPYHVNFSNPASYTAFDSTSFIFEGGALLDMVTLKSNFQTESRDYGSLGYLLFGLPVTKWWRTTIGLVPFSDVGYNVATSENVEGVGRVSRVYSGQGGVNRFFWGNGFRPFKNLSIGINASYIFGTMNREAAAFYPDSILYMNFKVDNDIILNDFYFSYGIQYHVPLKNDLKMTAGAVFATDTKINAKTDILAQTFLGGGTTGIEYPKDTIAQAEGYKGTILIPMTFGLGLSFDKTDKWTAGADFQWQNWEKFKAFDLSDSLVNSFQVSAGAEFIPDNLNYNKYLKRVRYRVGFFYNSTYLELRGKHLNEYAVSIGFGLPLKGMKTVLNLGGQLGTRGTTNNNLIRETYFKFIIGFSIYEKWFLKRKYY
jgi:hypothetical protein